MNFKNIIDDGIEILSNEHRKYFGLPELKENYTLKKICSKNNWSNYLFFDGNTLVKIINCFNSSSGANLYEYSVNYQVNDDKTLIKMKKGKEKKINITALNSLQPFGNYFYFDCDLKTKKGNVSIASFTNQKTFYEEENIPCNSSHDIISWCDKYVAESTLDDLRNVQMFANEERKHIKYQEGDYFRIKLGRNSYTYGRILIDIRKREKAGLHYWNNYAGVPLIIETFHILTNRKNVTIDELKDLETFPSQPIFDNRIYFGEYEIIGHDTLPDDIKYPITYQKKGDKIFFQCNNIIKEIPFDANIFIKSDDPYASLDLHVAFETPKAEYPGFPDGGQSGVGYNLENNIDVIRKCIAEKSNNHYWERYKNGYYFDLRSPYNKEKLKKILKQVDEEDLFKIYFDD